MTQDIRPRVIVGLFDNIISCRFVERSRSEPDTLFIDVGGTRTMLRGGALVTVPARARAIIAACLCAEGRIISRSEIAEILWGDAPDGGPDRADVAIGQALSAARIAGAALGIVITNHRGRGVSARLKPAGREAA